MRARMLTIPIALAIVALIAPLGTSPAVGATTPKFLTLPFQSPQHIHIQRGWWTPQFLGGPFTLKHHAIDYINGTLDVTSTWQNFPVVAAAAGEACAEVLGGSGCYDSFRRDHGQSGAHQTHRRRGRLLHLLQPPEVDQQLHPHRVAQQDRARQAGTGHRDRGCERQRPDLHPPPFRAPGRQRQVDRPLRALHQQPPVPDPKGKNGILSGPKNYFLTNPPTVLGAPASSTPSPKPSATPKASHRPLPTPLSSGPVATGLPTETGGPTPAQTQAPAATSSAAALVVPGTGGIPPPGGAASTGDLALTTIAAGILAVACFTFLAVVLLRRRLTGVGSGP